MRLGLILAGILLVILGAVAFTGVLDFTHDGQTVQIGDVAASMKDERSLPQWMGLVGIAVGLALIGTGALRK